MHIGFAPPSNGTYNNAGSSRQLANYMEHEDLERMEKGIYTEGFFNLTDDNIYKSKVIKDIDSNIGQLLKTDAKFYAIHVSPSEKELRVMGNTEQEQAEAMKRYIREVFIPEYAKNFNKELSEADIKFYGKIHFDRNRSNNELNMHCHLIVSRKDQANKKKLSPLTNHKNTKNGVVKGGFDRVNLFQQAEQGFDKLFNYNRHQSESFHYHNTMKNRSICEQIKHQEQKALYSKRKLTVDIENLLAINIETHTTKQERQNPDIPFINQGNNQISDIFTTFSTSSLDLITHNEEQPLKPKRKKKKRRNL